MQYPSCGIKAWFHPGTNVFLKKLPKNLKTHEGSTAIVIRWAVEAPPPAQWLVQLEDSPSAEQILVPEECLVLHFYVAPPEARSVVASTLSKRVKVDEDETAADKGASGVGRGLTALGALARGERLFEEEPLVLTPTGVASMHRFRWRAYMQLRLFAGESKEDAQNLLAFDRLTTGGHHDGECAQKILKEARQIMNEALRMQSSSGGVSGGGVDPILKEAEVARVNATLLRFQRNQFGFDNGTGIPASALFLFTSYMNHSCAPTVILRPWEAAVHGGDGKPMFPGLPVEGKGRVVATAACNVDKGEPLCINYGPVALLKWSLEKRRDYLLRKNGFFCQCRRCVAEELLFAPKQPKAAAASSAQKATKAAASPPDGGSGVGNGGGGEEEDDDDDDDELPPPLIASPTAPLPPPGPSGGGAAGANGSGPDEAALADSLTPAVDDDDASSAAEASGGGGEDDWGAELAAALPASAKAGGGQKKKGGKNKKKK